MAWLKMNRLPQIVLYLSLLAAGVNAGAQERKLFYREEPDYPAIAQKMNLHGIVKLKIWISPEGTVRRLEYIGGHPLLAESALKAVKAWKYEPNAKESTTMVEFRF
jgi:TonB family protein